MPTLEEIKKYEGSIEDMPPEVRSFIKEGGLTIMYHGKSFPSYEVKTFGKDGITYYVRRDTREDRYICIERKIKKITI
ncbi:MAG: hypothetical protein QXQ82_00390 [Candidatus Pacearchaeota archaeon]